MNENRIVLFEPYPKQNEFLEAVFSGKYRFVLYGGAIRGGKTYAMLGTFILLCKLFPGSRWAIVRDSLPTLKRNTIPSFEKICPKNFISKYNQDTQVVTFNNGSQILFFAENYNDDKELNRWKGLEVNGFGLEECNELQEVSFYKAIERAGTYIPKTGTKPPPVIMCTCNPSDGWVKRLWYTRHRDGTLPTEWKYIAATILDNPAICSDEAYMRSLKDLPPYQYDLFVNGNWDAQIDDLCIFEYEAIDNIFTNDITKQKDKIIGYHHFTGEPIYTPAHPIRHYITVDAARFGRDLCVIFVWKGWEVIHMSVFKKSDMHDITGEIEELRQKFMVLKRNVLVDQDGVGGDTVKYGKYEGFRGGDTAAEDPILRDGTEKYKNKKTQCYYRIAKRVNDGGIRLVVNNQTVKVFETPGKGVFGTKISLNGKVVDVVDLIKEDMKAIKRDKIEMDAGVMKFHINSKEAQKEILGRSPDFADTLMMREEFELRQLLDGIIKSQ